jgi:hypothetical protein
MNAFRKRLRELAGQGWLWFIFLWLGGVAGTALLVLPFRILVAMAMRK